MAVKSLPGFQSIRPYDLKKASEMEGLQFRGKRRKNKNLALSLPLSEVLGFVNHKA